MNPEQTPQKPVEIKPQPSMRIISAEVAKCRGCGGFRGWVFEQYNGGVEVLCRCDFDYYEKRKRPLPNPSMICPNGELFWKPISDYKDANGIIWHVPFFAGPGPA